MVTKKNLEKQVITSKDVGTVEAQALVTAAGASQELIAGSQMSDAARAFLAGAGKREFVPASIPIIKIDHKAALFVRPDGEEVPAVEGLPVFVYQTRRYYERPPAPGANGQPPDCFSPDMVAPHPDSPKKQHDVCLGCPKAQWGSARGGGRGQACSTYTWVFLLNSRFGAPPLAALVAPPSSIKLLEAYLARCMARTGGVYEIVWTLFKLARGGDLHCVLEPSVVRVIDRVEHVEKILEVRKQFLDAMMRLRGQVPDAEVSPEGPP